MRCGQNRTAADKKYAAGTACRSGRLEISAIFPRPNSFFTFEDTIKNIRKIFSDGKDGECIEKFI